MADDVEININDLKRTEYKEFAKGLCEAIQNDRCVKVTMNGIYFSLIRVNPSQNHFMLISGSTEEAFNNWHELFQWLSDEIGASDVRKDPFRRSDSVVTSHVGGDERLVSLRVTKQRKHGDTHGSV